MSARELEEYIHLIDETMSSSSITTATSSKYLTDIFSKRGSWTESLPFSNPVPKLWNPSFSSEFLGSSVTYSTTPPPPPSSSLKKNTISTTTAASSSSKIESQHELDSLNKLNASKRRPQFGRVIAKDLSPAITPENSPAPTRKKIKNRRSSVISSPPSPPRKTPPPIPTAPPLKPQIVVKKREIQVEDVSKKKLNLEDYTKSLKMLGIEVHSSTNKTIEENHSNSVLKTSPLKSGKLRSKRSLSLSDLKNAVSIGKKEVEIDEEVKDGLREAVFEKWRSEKLKVEIQKKIRIRQEQERERLKQEMKRAKAEEEFKNWLKSKVKKSEVKQLEPEVVKSEDKSNKRIQEWLENKEKEIREKRKSDLEMKRNKEREKRETEEKKKEENQRHFEEWSKVWTVKMKERKRQERELKEQEAERLQEKRAEAESAFKGWIVKKKKEMERKNKEKKENCDKEEKNKLEVTKSERSREQAEEAFEKWLSLVELRDNDLDHDSLFRELWKPPWYY